MRPTTYQDILDYLNSRNEDYILLSDEKDFEARKEEQKETGLYVKLLYECIDCGQQMEKSLACIKASKSVCRCRRCGSVKGSESMRANYQERIDILIDKGFKPLFGLEDIKNIKTRVKCIGSCGHEIETTLEAFCRSKTAMCEDCTRHIHDGENSYNWKGGTYDSEREAFRKSYEFKQFAKAVLKRDHYTCQHCGRTSRQLRVIVHHKDGYNWCVEKRTEVDNGVTLCDDCHKEFHHKYGYGNNTKEQFEEFQLN